MKKTTLFLFFVLVLTSCTYAITMVHTEGSATDVVDETSTNTPRVSASVPISGFNMPGD